MVLLKTQGPAMLPGQMGLRSKAQECHTQPALVFVLVMDIRRLRTLILYGVLPSPTQQTRPLPIHGGLHTKDLSFHFAAACESNSIPIP